MTMTTNTTPGLEILESHAEFFEALEASGDDRVIVTFKPVRVVTSG